MGAPASEKQLCQRHGAGSVCMHCPLPEQPPAPWARLMRQREAMRQKEEPHDPDSF